MPVRRGRAERVFGGITEIWIEGKCRILTPERGSNFCRFGWTARLKTDGMIRPERGGYNVIVVPEGHFFVYSNHLRRTIDPKGGRNFAYIYEKSVTPCQEV